MPSIPRIDVCGPTRRRWARDKILVTAIIPISSYSLHLKSLVNLYPNVLVVTVYRLPMSSIEAMQRQCAVCRSGGFGSLGRVGEGADESGEGLDEEGFEGGDRGADDGDVYFEAGP